MCALVYVFVQQDFRSLVVFARLVGRSIDWSLGRSLVRILVYSPICMLVCSPSDCLLGSLAGGWRAGA